MSEEMVTRTADSPAAATGNVGSALIDFVREAAGPSESGSGALNQSAEQSSTPSEQVSGVYDQSSIQERVKQQLLDNVLPDKQPGNVPYERFKEVNDEAKQLRAAQEAYSKWADVIRQFEESGFSSAADVQKAYQEQQLQSQEAQIRERWNYEVQNNYMDPEMARIQAESEVQKFRYDQVVSQMNSYMMAQQREQALQQFPYASRAMDVMDSLIQQGMNPMDAASAVHRQVTGLVESLVPQLVDMVTNQQSSPTPIGSGDSANPVVPQQQSNQQNRMSSITRLLGIR
jgi:hypothetical protein